MNQKQLKNMLKAKNKLSLCAASSPFSSTEEKVNGISEYEKKKQNVECFNGLINYIYVNFICKEICIVKNVFR